MNKYCAYLNIPFPLFKDNIDPLQLQRIRHFKLDKSEILSNEIQEWFASLKLDILLVEVFYTPPNEISTIHYDSVGGNYTKLNWQFGGKNSKMNWYSTNGLHSHTKVSTPIGSNSAIFKPDDVTQIHSQAIQNPSLVQVGIPHNIENFNEDRWVVSIVYKYPNTKFLRPTWISSLKIFNQYLVPPPGIEPGSSVLQTGAMTTSAKAAKLG